MDADAGLAGRGKTAAFVGAEPSFSFFLVKSSAQLVAER
jgi:hypothetical protein